MIKSFKILIIFLLFFFSVNLIFASETQGVIDGTYKYAWGENIGWINFGCDNCNASVTDTSITGYAWSKQYGWINLNPTTGGVKNDGNGTLSGSAWGKNIGWIDFAGVTINSNGDFLGYATLKSDNSKINFNCANGDSCSSAKFEVKTDWRPASMRQSGGISGGNSGNNGNSGNSSTTPPASPPVVSPPANITTTVTKVVNNFSNIVNSATNYVINLFNPKNTSTQPNILVQVPETAPLALNTKWNLLPTGAIKSFVFAPLPYEVSVLISKFPDLGNTFKDVGVQRMTDMNKLINVTFNVPGLAGELSNTLQNISMEKLTNINNLNGVALNVPGLSNGNGNIQSNLGVGKIALIPGLPLANFSLAEKKNLPPEFVFARADGEQVDLPVALSINDTGGVSQKISSLPGQMLKLVVKPISKARSVTGYFAFNQAAPKVSENSISRASLSASALFSMNGLVENTDTTVPVEQKLILSSFEYTDSNHDGIYTADVASPGVPGTYEVVTVIDYVDPVLGIRKMSMITVVDPEGYVYEKNGDKETRIPEAVVSLYRLNNATQKYELWDAKSYQQLNPQITDVSGTYSFLVPEGTYYFQVKAPGYTPYQGETFIVAQGGGIHQNIEMKSNQNFFSNFDWKTALLIVVLLLLVYNLLRNPLKNGLSKIFKKS